jgi:hypothetical protein
MQTLIPFPSTKPHIYTHAEQRPSKKLAAELADDDLLKYLEEVEAQRLSQSSKTSAPITCYPLPVESAKPLESYTPEAPSQSDAYLGHTSKPSPSLHTLPSPSTPNPEGLQQVHTCSMLAMRNSASAYAISSCKTNWRTCAARLDCTASPG